MDRAAVEVPFKNDFSNLEGNALEGLELLKELTFPFK